MEVQILSSAAKQAREFQPPEAIKDWARVGCVGAKSSRNLKRPYRCLFCGNHAFILFPKAQLAAGGIDIVTFFAADGSPNACGEERPAEKMNCLFRGTFVGETLDFVVGNQIHFGVKTTGMLGEQASLFRTVVDSRKKDVFEKDLFFPRFDKCVACREEAVEGVAFIDRHDFIDKSYRLSCHE